jgi:ABC-type sugar transport system permease subunit
MKQVKAYLYILPSITILAFVIIYPLYRLFFYSFTKWEGIYNYVFVGLKNYVDILSSSFFWKIMANNFLLFLLIPIEVSLGVLIAWLIYERIFLWRFHQTMIFLPVVLSIVVCGIVWTYFFQSDGIINTILRFIGLGKLTKHVWLVDPVFALPAVGVVILWRDMGFAMILFLARLQSIPAELFEAAKLDGASKLQLLRYIVVPLMRGIIEIYVVLSIIGFLNSIFTYIYVMTGGGPGYKTTVIEYYIFRKGFRELRIGYASALSVILFMITMILAFLQMKFFKGEEEV